MSYIELMVALEESGIQVDKRTIQNDIVVFNKEYGAEFDPGLKRGRERLFRYKDTGNSIFINQLSQEEKGIISRVVDKLRIHDDIPHYQWIIYILDGLVNIDKYEDDDFCFCLIHDEFKNLMSLNLISSWGGRRTPPGAFTDSGNALLILK